MKRPDDLTHHHPAALPRWVPLTITVLALGLITGGVSLAVLAPKAAQVDRNRRTLEDLAGRLAAVCGGLTTGPPEACKQLPAVVVITPGVTPPPSTPSSSSPPPTRPTSSSPATTSTPATTTSTRPPPSSSSTAPPASSPPSTSAPTTTSTTRSALLPPITLLSGPSGHQAAADGSPTTGILIAVLAVDLALVCILRRRQARRYRRDHAPHPSAEGRRHPPT